MSLQIWLPLTKDLRQQGLSNIDFVNTGITLASSGKLGEKCGSFESGKRLYSTNFSIGSIFSISTWINFQAFGSYANRCITGLVGYDNNNNRNIQFQLGCLSSDGNVAQWKFNDYGNCGAINLNTWYHICVTYDGGQAYIYENGQLINTFSVSLPAVRGNFLSINGLTSKNDGSTASATGTFTLNDFRIYDHCLSPMEVKELAKGLVLHYPLNRNGWGQENLLKNSNFLQGTNGMQGYTATSATCTKQTDCMKVVSTSASGGFYSSNFDSITTGDMTIFSADVKADSNMTIYIGTDGSGNGSCQAYTVGNTWQRISISKAKTTNNANLRIYGNGTFYAKNLKYELGSIATPWCPNSSDALATTMGLNSTIEYDCSGFCNNGTRTSTFSWTSDTPKYSVSQVFSGSQRIEAPFNPGNSPTFTVAGWFYHTGGTTYYGAKNNYNTFICLEGGRYFVYNSAGSAYVGNWSSVANTWQHIVLVHDAVATKLKLYVNGQFISEVTTNGTIYNSNILDIGGRQGVAQYSGKMSDFRIYATALSAADVKSLYQNCATIDPDGTIRGQIRS